MTTGTNCNQESCVSVCVCVCVSVRTKRAVKGGSGGGGWLIGQCSQGTHESGHSPTHLFGCADTGQSCIAITSMQTSLRPQQSQCARE